MKRVLILFAGCIFLLSGCRKSPEIKPMGSVITGISVCRVHDGQVKLNSVSDEKEITFIMEQFRHLNSHFPTDSPKTEGNDIYSIRVECANGSIHTYDRLDGFYFRKDHGRWRRSFPLGTLGLRSIS